MLPPIPLHTSNEVIMGRPRPEWVVGICRAICLTMTPHLQWSLWKAGFDEFVRAYRIPMSLHTPCILLTHDEMRWMFLCLEAGIPERYREAEMAKEIEKYQKKVLTDADLKGDTLDGDGSVQNHDGPTTHEDGVTMETLPDREKRLVN